MRQSLNVLMARQTTSRSLLPIFARSQEAALAAVSPRKHDIAHADEENPNLAVIDLIFPQLLILLGSPLCSGTNGETVRKAFRELARLFEESAFIGLEDLAAHISGSSFFFSQSMIRSVSRL